MGVRYHWISVVPFLAWVLTFNFSSEAKDVTEKFDDGKLKVHYRTDGNDHKTGPYEEFHPNGRMKVRGQYTADKKSGRWQIFDDAGKPQESANYRNDLLDGLYTWDFPSGKPGVKALYSMGQLAGSITTFDEKGRTTRVINYPRSRQLVEKTFESLYPHEAPVKFLTEAQVSPPYQAGTLSPESLEPALKLAQLYRFASGLRWEDLKTDPGLCDLSAHGAVVLAKLGKLTHTPEQPPDMDAAFFKSAYAGCHEANIYSGDGNPVSSVRAFMDDSDGNNIDVVGHRQWILSPGLQRIGFGSAKRYVSMHVFDGARAVKIEFNYIAYPGEGYYPIQLIPPQAGWSIHFNRAKVRLGPSSSLNITLQKLDEHYQPMSEPISAKVINCPAAMSPTFGWDMVIFKPDLAQLEPARYWVNITGVKTLAGADAPFGYIVELFDPTANAASNSAAKP